MEIRSNIADVLAALARVEVQVPADVPARVRRLGPEPFRAAARTALQAALLPAEAGLLYPLLATVMVGAPAPGRTRVEMGVPGVLERARSAVAELSRLRHPAGRRPVGLPVEQTRAEAAQARFAAGGGVIGRLQSDVLLARRLVDLWIHAEVTPDPADPESGKDLTAEDRELMTRPAPDGSGDDLLTHNLLTLLGLKPARHRTPAMAAAGDRLARRLGLFAATALGAEGGDTGIPAARLATLFQAVLAAWLKLLEETLPGLFHDAVAAAVRGGRPN